MKGLPELQPTNVVGRGEFVVMSDGTPMTKWYYDTSKLPEAERSVARSKTFPGIARAMAEQWAGDCRQEGEMQDTASSVPSSASTSASAPAPPSQAASVGAAAPFATAQETSAVCDALLDEDDDDNDDDVVMSGEEVAPVGTSKTPERRRERDETTQDARPKRAAQEESVVIKPFPDLPAVTINLRQVGQNDPAMLDPKVDRASYLESDYLDWFVPDIPSEDDAHAADFPRTYMFREVAECGKKLLQLSVVDHVSSRPTAQAKDDASKANVVTPSQSKRDLQMQRFDAYKDRQQRKKPAG